MVIHFSTDPLAHGYASQMFWFSTTFLYLFRMGVAWYVNCTRSVVEFDRLVFKMWAFLNLIQIADLWFLSS